MRVSVTVARGFVFLHKILIIKELVPTVTGEVISTVTGEVISTGSLDNHMKPCPTGLFFQNPMAHPPVTFNIQMGKPRGRHAEIFSKCDHVSAGL